MESTIYNLMLKNRNASIKAFKVAKETKGLWCVIKEPVDTPSIFGLEDVADYDELKVRREKLLLYGIFQEGEQGMQEYDTFIDAYALTLWEDRLPQQTLIEVQFCNRTMTFKVDTHRNVTPSTCKQLFIKNMLVPAT